MARHYFLGGNTPVGFFSYYDYLLKQEAANKIYVIKGGPGTGKSTLMKGVGKWAEESGFEADYLHCSSDPDSLDGLIISDLNIAMVDGTAPHIVDPKNPGAVDRIVNLGEFWDEAAIRENKENIIRYNKEIKGNFARAYRYLNAANAFFDDLCEIYKEFIDEFYIAETAEAIIAKEISPLAIKRKKGESRKLFATAITPVGVVSYVDSLAGDYKVYTVKSEWGTGGEALLSKIAQSAMLSGYQIETFYNPMRPETYIEHVVIKDLKLAVLTQNKYNSFAANAYEIIDLNAPAKQAADEGYKEEIAFDLSNMYALIERAANTISKSKEIHDRLEDCYIPNMYFPLIKEKQNEILEDIKKQI